MGVYYFGVGELPRSGLMKFRKVNFELEIPLNKTRSC